MMRTLAAFSPVAVLLALAAPARGQIPLNPPVRAATPRPTPNTAFAKQLLPPAPDVSDWQPHDRAVAGGRIVITGTGFRPQEFEAVVGPSKYRLPVRVASRHEHPNRARYPRTRSGSPARSSSDTA